jgi:hypothetical protein
VQQGDEVLDLACGVGFGSRLLTHAGGIVLEVDRDQASIADARATAREGRFRCSDFFGPSRRRLRPTISASGGRGCCTGIVEVMSRPFIQPGRHTASNNAHR